MTRTPLAPQHFAIKVRKDGEQTWSFLTPRGGTNRLRLHAAIVTQDRAREIVEHWDNPGYSAKIVELS